MGARFLAAKLSDPGGGGRRRRCPGADRLGRVELQQAAADLAVLQLQFDAHLSPGGGAGRKGVAALQEAGLIDIQPLAAVPRVEVLGVLPTLEGMGAQLATLLMILVGFRRRRAEART